MDKFTKLTSVAAPLPLINVDTDMIIPARFLKTIKRTGLGKSLFFVLRFDDDGNERSDFVLNKPAYKGAKILVTGKNFGCGSSREHAPWALADYGMLLIKLPQEQVDKMMDDAERGANATVTVDLEAQEITGPDGGLIKFDIDPFKKHCLLNGLDDIGLTLQKEDKISAFEASQKASQPWL